ncbi:signal peptidase I [Vibrio astriarenae]
MNNKFVKVAIAVLSSIPLWLCVLFVHFQSSDTVRKGVGESMAPTIKDTSFTKKQMIDKGTYLPKYGDVVTYQVVIDEQVIEGNTKRVVGLPGDTVLLDKGKLFINGNPVFDEAVGENDTYVFFREKFEGVEYHVQYRKDSPLLMESYPEWQVPENHLFTLGDNRSNSQDSKFSSHGYVPIDSVYSKTKEVLFNLVSAEGGRQFKCSLYSVTENVPYTARC